MAPNSEFRDYTTIAGVKDFVLNDIAPKYFPDISEVSKLNVGLFGMMVDIGSTGLFDTMQVASRYITEIIPGKSQLPDFIYAQANNFGITDLFAKCAKCNALIMVKEDDIIKNGTIVGNGISEYTISSDCIIYIDEVPFSLPFDIRVRSININGTYNHQCVYDQSVKNSIIESVLPYAQCMKTHIVNEKQTYLAISVDLYQYLKITQEENITTNNMLNIPIVEVSYSDQLANFEVFYKSPDATEYTQLTKLLETNPPMSTPFVYYKLSDDGTYRLSFANDDRYFVPEYNSSIKIITFQTIGTDGNFNRYGGDNVYIASVDPNVLLNCTMTSDSTGGDDAHTLDEIRRLTWEKQLTVDSYTTDNDLNVFFSLGETVDDTTKSYFIKIRDDFATRIIACYSRLKDEMDIFPTNTLDANIKIENIDSTYTSDYKFIINAGARFVYDNNNYTCKLISDDDEAPADGIEYTNIALISMRTSPTNTIAYYMNSIDKKVAINYEYLNNDALHQFIVSDLHVKRNAVIGEKDYKFTMTLLPSDLTVSSDDDGNVGDVTPGGDASALEFDPHKIKVFIYIPRSNSTAHYQELIFDDENSSDSGYIFKGCMETDDMVDDDNIQLINVPHVGSTLSGFCPVDMQNPGIKFLVFYQEDSSVYNQYNSILPDVSGLRLCNEYTASKDELYFAYPMSLMDSMLTFKEVERPMNCELFDSSKVYSAGDLVYVESTEGGDLRYECMVDGQYDRIDKAYWKNVPTYSFVIKSIPLFGHKFLKDEHNMTIALTNLTTHYTRLKRILVDMTANFSLALKFFNTYGRSNIFSISNGLGKTEVLNRTHCNIWLSIKFHETSDYLSVIPNIKYTIKTYIESISNDKNSTSSINKVNMSNLIKKLHDAYPSEIDYIIFNSFNGYDSSYQNIDMLFDLTLPENNNQIPEFLTLSMDDIKITILNATI